MLRRISFTLPLILVATSLFGFAPGSCGGDVQVPPVCTRPDGTLCSDPMVCAALAETDCMTRSDCQPIYAYPDCGPTADCAGKPVFQGCQVVQCHPVMCDLACAHGFARDAKGCDLCACSPVPCNTDQECGPGEACLYPHVDCPADARCMAPQGTCGRVDQGCGSDSECKAGERCLFPTIDCPPDAFCAPARGTCKVAPDRCNTDADCAPGQHCAYVMTPDFGNPSTAGVCIDGLPDCTALDETHCNARPDCSAIYEYPRCGNDPHGPYFQGCKAAACQPVMCLLYCAKGYAKDANGCDTCGCDDSCQSDADCQPGQSCLMAMATHCAPGSNCLPKGLCQVVQKSCLDDSQCASGERCSLPEIICPPGVPCPAPVGMCQKVDCRVDADCRAGETCALTLTNCGGKGTGGGCMGGDGVCVPAPKPCGDDSQCAPGERCSADPMSNCGLTTNCVGFCQPNRCQSDSECRPGESCIFPMYDYKCASDDANCPPLPYDGMCNAIPKGCSANTDCAANEQCAKVPCDPASPNTTCAQCVARPVCSSDKECGMGESCQPDPTDICNSPAADCFRAGRTICLPVAVATCSSDKDCAAGQTCQPDPTDPCNQPQNACFAPGRTICQ